MAEPKRIHLDTDIGGDLDDLCALAMLLGWPGVELTGVTTVLEHGGRRAGYACRALELAGRSEVPVAAGAEVASGVFQLEAGLPDEAAYWPKPVAPRPGPVDAALDLLEASLRKGAIIVAIGPFTNLWLLERRQPGILRTVSIVMMGGCINALPAWCPDWDFRTDYNVQAHPDAARLVLECSEPTLVPIEVTAQTALTRDQLPRLANAGPLAALIAHQAEVFAEEWHNEARYDRINFQHDPLACAVALGWPGARIEALPLVVDQDGQWLRMSIDSQRGRPRPVVTAVDSAAFSDVWLARVAQAADPAPARQIG